MIYRQIKIKGANGETLVLHMTNYEGKPALEIMTPYGYAVVVSQEQFQQMNGWVETEFARHGSTIRYAH
jgi:hypothetical protein